MRLALAALPLGRRPVEILTFELDGGLFGIRASQVREVLRAVAISPLPGAPQLEGVIDLRGRVLPVADLRRLLGLPPKPLQPSDHLIVVQGEELLFAFRADRALDLVRLEDAAVDAAGAIVPGIEGIGQLARTPEGLVRILSPALCVQAATLATSADMVPVPDSAEAGK